MKVIKSIINSGIADIMSELDKVGAKKASRDVVKAGLAKIEENLETELLENADKLHSRLVVTSLENTLKEFRTMAGI